MAKLEELTRGAAVKGILPDCLVTLIDVKWCGLAQVKDRPQKLVYIRKPFQQEMKFSVESNYYHQELLGRGGSPA